MSEPQKPCANCNTERFAIFRRGYCYRCYPLVLRKEQLRELEYCLELFKMWEAQRSEKVSGLQIEHALRNVAKWCGAKKRTVPRRRVTKRRGGKEDLLYGIANDVTEYFGPEARRVLLGWLLDIEESMPWDPRRYWHALHPERVQEMVAQNRAESERRDSDNSLKNNNDDSPG